MRTIILKVLCWLCVACMTNVLAFHNKHLYTNSKTKDYHKNHRHHSIVSSYKPHSLYHSNSFYNLNKNEVRLRHSRYPNLNSVMTRLDNMQSRTTTITTTSTTTPTPVTTLSPYRYIKNNRRDNLFLDNNPYGEEEISSETDSDDWDAQEDQNTFEGEMDEDDDDADDEDDVEASWQAEEPTTETSVTSSLMDYKLRSYASPNQIEGISRKKTFPEYSPKAEANAAMLHALKMNTESRCREPLPRVVSIQTEHPDPGKNYVPHCTVLHRCAEDTGCCPNHATVCAPKTQVVVQLYFYTTTIGKPGNKIEKLPFTNHTECACLQKPHADATPENTSPEVSRSYRSHLPAKVITQVTHATLPRCKCPEEYTPILLKNSGCTCDCTDSNIDCGLIKRGNEFFSMKDRKCIINKECSTPKCEYGPYMTHIGRCPRRNEKIEVPTGVH